VEILKEVAVSTADVERFVMDARGNEKLQNELKNAVGVSAVVEVAKKHGSNMTEPDMRAWLDEQNSQLSEKELDSVAGGVQWGLRDQFP
jgi:predicted ribosomally synthesized peptide with nif11-like leader